MTRRMRRVYFHRLLVFLLSAKDARRGFISSVLFISRTAATRVCRAEHLFPLYSFLPRNGRTHGKPNKTRTPERERHRHGSVVVKKYKQHKTKRRAF